jgi:hypothetical protein
MNCPTCNGPLSFANRVNYNNVQMCVLCAYQQMPLDSPGRKQLERNYPEVIAHEQTPTLPRE